MQVLFCVTFWFIFSFAPSFSLPSEQKLIVVMLDGARWDYFNAKDHPGFLKIKESGSVAEYVQPILPSSSFESWTTISTGRICEIIDFLLQMLIS